jgi:Spy/CpxP family protein refolding chaperone
MRKSIGILMVVSFAALTAFGQTADPKPPSAQTLEEAMKQLRSDSQAAKADVMAKNMTLSAEQAAKFWPLFETYQKEQNGIIDEQLKGIRTFVEKYDTLDDATAMTLMNAHIDRDAKMNALRKKWLGEFQKVLPSKLAVRAMQIDRRLSLAMQSEIASRIPLAH